MGKRKVPEVAVVDFETKAIKRRPEYPPLPVGVSIIPLGQTKPTYYAFGHYEGNNCDESKPRAILRDMVRSGTPLLFHNGKFDLDVAETHWGIPMPDWRLVHDTMYLLFLTDPHAATLSLKPSADRILGMPPEERDRVQEWVLAHKKQIEAVHGPFTPKEWGAFISEAPGTLVGPYANGDTVRTLKLFRKLYPEVAAADMLPAYDRERQIMPILLNNERQGMRVAAKKLHTDIATYHEARDKVDNWLRKRLKAPSLDFNKDVQVADALEASGVVTDFVLTATGKKSVAKGNLTPDMFHDKRVASALGYRNRLTTCLSMFMETWDAMASASGGWIHTNWNQVRSTGGGGNVGARTGRMSSSPNFMNIPTDWYDKNDGYVHPKHIAVPELPMIRGYVLPDDARSVFAGRDYSQQELRILAHFEDGKLLEAYNEDPNMDVHAFVGDAIARITGHALPRKAVKILNFGTIYGMGLGKLAAGMDVDVETAKQVNNARKNAMPGLRALEESIKGAARSDMPIRTWGGRLYYKEPSKIINGRTVDFGYKLLNYLIQGSAADCTKQAIINYDQVKKEGRFLVTVHDEINLSVPKKAAKAELLLLRDAMADVAFDLPMLSDPNIGPDWGTAKKYKE